MRILKFSRKSLASLACLMCLVSGQVEGVELAAAASGPAALTVVGSNDTAAKGASKIGVVNFRKCIEGSKQGKQHQASFEGMKSQMETLLQQREKALTEMNAKLQDADYLDGLTKEAKNELQHKFRVQSQEYAQAQQQFMQTLQQANLKIIEMLNSDVAKASTEVAQTKGFSNILNDESLFFFDKTQDVSELVIAEMNKAHDIEQKKRDEASKGAPAPKAAVAPVAPAK